MRDYKHLAKKPKQKKYRKITILSAGALAVIYGYHLYDLLIIWMRQLEMYIQSEPFALFPVILIIITILMIGGGTAWDIMRNYFRKKGRGMATMR